MQKTMEFCSPTTNGKKKKTCFSKNSLILIANGWNSFNPTNKIIFNSKEGINSLLSKINEKFEITLKKKNIYWAWTDILKSYARKVGNSKVFDDMKSIEMTELRPSQPSDWVKNPVEWLSNFDIEKVMKQYENIPAFKYKFHGVFSIDFGIKNGNTCSFSSHCHINVKNLITNNKIKYFGFITNLSKHNEAGTHWTSSFFVFDPKLKCYGGYYYDSTTGNIPNELKPVFDDIKRQAEEIFKKPFPIYINQTRHQRSNTECGVFSITFQTRFLLLLKNDKKNASLEAVVSHPDLTDDKMKKLRFLFFRPNINSLKTI
jgi:hypothetical protein